MERRCHHDIANRTSNTIRPRIDENPPIPENIPPPNNRPNRPAPMKPAARPRKRPPPGRLKKPPPRDEPGPGLPGWVMVRLNGCAVFGAVDVLGGIEKVRDPREPELKPPPTRASAGERAESVGSASDRTTAMAWTNLRPLKVKFMCLFPI